MLILSFGLSEGNRQVNIHLQTDFWNMLLLNSNQIWSCQYICNSMQECFHSYKLLVSAGKGSWQNLPKCIRKTLDTEALYAQTDYFATTRSTLLGYINHQADKFTEEKERKSPYVHATSSGSCSLLHAICRQTE